MYALQKTLKKSKGGSYFFIRMHICDKIDLDLNYWQIKTMSYQGVMRLAREHPFRPKGGPSVYDVDWLKVVRGCYEEAKSHGGNRFAGSWVYKRQEVGWFPNLRMLDEEYSILRKVAQTSKQTFYVMPDIKGVARALHELGYL